LERVCRAYSRPDVACRLLQLNHDVRAKPTGTLDPRREGGLDLLPFLDVSRPLPCGIGDTRRAALRPPVRPQCWLFPLARACPTVMPEQSPHHEDAFGAPCVVRIDAHGSKDRAKDASAERKRRSLVLASGAYALCACATTFPSSASSGHPLSSARLPSREETRYGPTDRPRPSFRQRPAKSATFQKTRMPSTATTREGDIAERLLPPALTPALPLTPPTPYPLGEGAFDGHCKVTVRSPAGP